MYLIAFATDYDGTLAHHGRVDAPTIAALERLKASGRKLLMVTGRDLPDLQHAFDRLDLFDMVVAKNGALLRIAAVRTVAQARIGRLRPMSSGSALY